MAAPKIMGSLPVPESAELLQRRLEDGYARIEKAMADGQAVTNWEDFWIDLLHQYERECDEAYEASVPVGYYAPKE